MLKFTSTSRTEIDHMLCPSERSVADLELDLSSLSAEGRYALLNSVVVPRPIALICTVDLAGAPNLAPFSYFNVCSLTPPIVHFTSTSSVDSIANVKASEEFVANMVGEELIYVIGSTASTEPADDAFGEFSRAGLTAHPSVKVKAPRVAQAQDISGVLAQADICDRRGDDGLWRGAHGTSRRFPIGLR